MNQTAAILVVDDDASVCKTLQRILERKGYRVDVAHTGKEALAKTSERAYDVVLMDMKLPASNGVKTFMAIKEIRSETAGVLMTGHPGEMADLIKESVDGGLVNACFYKPLNVEELLMSIEQIWSAKNRTSAAEMVKTMLLARLLTFALICFVLWAGCVMIFPFVGSNVFFQIEQPVEVVKVDEHYVKLRFVQHAAMNLVVDTANQLHCDTVQVMPSRLNIPIGRGEHSSDDWVVFPNVAINGGRGNALCFYTGTMSYNVFGALGPRVTHHWTSETFYVKRKGY